MVVSYRKQALDLTHFTSLFCFFWNFKSRSVSRSRKCKQNTEDTNKSQQSALIFEPCGRWGCDSVFFSSEIVSWFLAELLTFKKTEMPHKRMLPLSWISRWNWERNASVYTRSLMPCFAEYWVLLGFLSCCWKTRLSIIRIISVVNTGGESCGRGHNFCRVFGECRTPPHTSFVVVDWT